MDIKKFKWEAQEIPITQLKPHPKNKLVRRITSRQKEGLKESLRKFGQVDFVVCTKDYMLIAGHQRVDVMKEMGYSSVKVLVCQDAMSDKDCDELMLRHNKNTGEFNEVGLSLFESSFLVEIGWEEDSLQDVFPSESPSMDLDDVVGKEMPKYPLAEAFNENHDYVLIAVKRNEDFSYLCKKLGLQKVRSRISGKVGMGRVVSFERFCKAVGFNVSTLDTIDNG